MTLISVAGVDELLAVRFAWSPLWESMHAVRTFCDPKARTYHEPWHRLVAGRVAQLDLEALIAVQPPHGFVPDFLTPPPRTSDPRVRDQLAEVRATPPTQVARELRLCRPTVKDTRHGQLIDSFLRDPAAARDFLADRLHDVWRELVAPFWIRIRALLDRDIQERSRGIARHGLRHVLDDLHPRIRWTSRGLSIRDGGRATIRLGDRGLVLMPGAYVWPSVAAIIDEPWQPTIAYPARGIAELWHAPPPPPDALGRLIGRTRALVLASLDQPASTHVVAALLGLSAAGASGHLLALRDAGLLSTTRRGHEVLYARTALGTTLLRARPN
jgi:DNA-binding transcriptional ArsR family regulator